uniref:Putative esophageal gland cell secretory protein 30 n=1 Tax=Meloidogyne incognita TaxID=6306 RepID=Q7YWE0_MELIC|nr:putative esophageal gland cell secretory protein 30 [Meloidogyne incognita]
MYPWTIFLLLIILLAMAIEIIGGKGRKLRKRDKEEKGHASIFCWAFI